jgi:hypothetical protein
MCATHLDDIYNIVNIYLIDSPLPATKILAEARFKNTRLNNNRIQKRSVLIIRHKIADNHWKSSAFINGGVLLTSGHRGNQRNLNPAIFICIMGNRLTMERSGIAVR